MIKVGEKYTANGNEWEITGIDDEGIHLVWADYLINVDHTDEYVYVYRKFKNGNTRGIYWAFSFDEIKMVNEIIDKLKGESKNIEKPKPLKASVINLNIFSKKLYKDCEDEKTKKRGKKNETKI